MYDLDDYDVQVVVECNDKNAWTLQPFFLQFHKYFEFSNPPQPYHVIGYSRPPFPFPAQWEFISLGNKNVPAERWTDGIINYLNNFCKKTLIIFLLSDYWLVRPVDAHAIWLASNIAYYNADVLRVDLTADRQFAGDAQNRGYFDKLDIVETPHTSPYQMSFQAGIWRRDILSRVLVPRTSAWAIEFHIQPPERYHVYGTKQCPVRYSNALKTGKLDMEALSILNKKDYDEVMSFVPEGIKILKPGEEQ